LWEKIVIDEPGTSETGRLADVDSDGQLDVLPSGTSFAAWYDVVDVSPQGVQWKRNDLPSELIEHGIGAGDLNGDGRIDIVGPHGWAEGPKDPRRDRWVWHAEFQLAEDCGLPILCHDVDADGDNDLIWARGHDIGLYWTEQRGEDETSISTYPPAATVDTLRQIEQRKWITHAIDTSWACGHTLMLADIDGDGADDLVAAKRFMGHDGRDPGENDPLSVHWYRYDKQSKTWKRHLISSGGTCGVDLDSTCVDLDGDGDMDILAPARSGLHWIENLRISQSPVGTSSSPGSAASGGAANGGAASAHPAAMAPSEFVPYESHDRFDYVIAANGEQKPLANPLDHGLRRQHILRQMEQVMGPLPSSIIRVPLDIQVQSVEDAGKYSRIKLTYQAEPGDRVPAYLLVPHAIDSPRPAVLCLHPTHFKLGKAQVCGLGGTASRAYAHELAEAGYVCLAPDYPGFGDYEFDFNQHQEQYASGSMKAIWNNIRGLDLLETLPCVDRDRLAALGHSLGGHNALFTAAFDQRVRCVLSSCGFTAFADYYQGDLTGWSSDRYMPRIASQYHKRPESMPFDFPEVLAAILPRPIFVNAPVHDSNFAVAGVRKCQASLQPLLGILGEEVSVEFVYPDAEHDFPDAIRQQAYQWLEERFR
jgi:dienelactone hydrolase